MNSNGVANLKVVDIYHGDDVNFGELKARGYDGVIIKATQGKGVVDSALINNYNAAKAVGLHVGFYHYLDFQSDVQAQINNFINATSGLKSDYKIALDVERDNKYNATIPSDLTTRCKQWLEAIKSRFGAVMVYANCDMICNHFDSSMGAYDLWIAQYGVTQPSDVPYFSSWIGWQTGDSGIDEDIFTSDIFMSGSQPAPVPSKWTSDVYPVGSLPCEWNATALEQLTVCNADGTPCNNHYISRGDQFIVLAANTSLAEVEYPVQDGWVHGYVTNSNIQCRWHNGWRTDTDGYIPILDKDGNTVDNALNENASFMYVVHVEAIRNSPVPADRVPIDGLEGAYAIFYTKNGVEEGEIGYTWHTGGFTL